MPIKLIIHLVFLLLLFILLNGVVKWVIIPEIQSYQTEAQKKTQIDLGKVLMDVPLLGDYIEKLQKKLDTKSQTALDKKNQPYVIEFFLKQPELLAKAKVLFPLALLEL